MSASEEVRMMLLKEAVSIKKLAALLSGKYNKEITPNSLTQKLKRDAVKYQDLKDIAEVLGYTIRIERKFVL